MNGGCRVALWLKNSSTVVIQSTEASVDCDRKGDPDPALFADAIEEAVSKSCAFPSSECEVGIEADPLDYATDEEHAHLVKGRIWLGTFDMSGSRWSQKQQR